MATRNYDLVVEDGLPVKLPSGAAFSVLTQDEVDYVNDRARRYLSDNHFSNVSDMQDVDRMIAMEVLAQRWGSWLARQKDYWDEPVSDEASLRRILGEYSSEVRQIKKSLGIDKVGRDKQRGDDSVAEYLTQLRRRAEEFGVMRNEQFYKVLELFKQLQALITQYDNSDETERQEMNLTTVDLLDWIRNIAFVEFSAIDEDFRANKQQIWIRSQ